MFTQKKQVMVQLDWIKLILYTAKLDCRLPGNNYRLLCHMKQSFKRGDIVMVMSWRHGNPFRILNSLRPRRNRRHFADDIFKCIFLNENVWIPIKSSLKFVPKGSINNIPALVQIMAWRRPGDKPLSEPMMVCLTTHICVTRPQWVKRGIHWSAVDVQRDGNAELLCFLFV